MFEAIISLCLQADPAICRDVLLPTYEAENRATCEQLLARKPPELQEFLQDYLMGDIACRQAGVVADFTEAAPGVFVHRGIVSDAAADNGGDVANIGFVIGDDAVAVIDSGGSRMVAEQAYRALREQTDLPIRYVILTHMHPDHVLGASVFVVAGAQVIGHAALEQALLDRKDTYLTNFGRLIGAEGFLGTEVRLPDITVDLALQIDLGNRILDLQAWPNAHTGTDLTVGDKTSGILFTGDLMFDHHAPALDGSVLGWQQVLGEIQGLPYRHIMPGHGGPILDWPQSAAALGTYLDVLVDDTRAAIKRGDTLGRAVETIGQSQANEWELFDLFNPRNATVAYTELEWE